MSKILLGNARHQLDDKGRMRIPAKFREGLGAAPIILPGRAGCLFIVPSEKFDEVISSISGDNPYANTEQNELLTFVTSAGSPIEEDGQGRMRLDKSLASVANINKEVVFVGKVNYVEVWAAEAWDARYSVLNPDNLNKMLERLKKIGV